MMRAENLESIDAHPQQLAIGQCDETDGAWSSVNKSDLAKD
jgi:hypothetical protein